LHDKGVEAVIITKEEIRERGFIYALEALGLKIFLRPGLTLADLQQKLPCPEERG
jgi:hypothetical protein